MFDNDNDLCSSSNTQKINNASNEINKFAPLFATNLSIETNVNLSLMNAKEDGDDGNKIDCNNTKKYCHQ